MDPSTPIPKDLPLALPVPELFLQVLLITFFLIHILFVNLTVGGTLLTLYYEIRGLFRPDYDALAERIASTITVNKSLAVVFGVGPLLVINLLYTIHFYSANALTGDVWIAIVPLVTVAFLLTYLHKYTWKALAAHKGLHITIIAAGAALFLAIPFIFLVNINLMLFPEKWRGVHSFWDALFLPNVIPRYIHFIIASLAVTGLFLVKWTGRESFHAVAGFTSLTRADLKTGFYSLALGASGLQFIAGPLVFFTMPPAGMSGRMMLVLAIGVTAALPALHWMWQEIKRPTAGDGARFWHIIGALTITVVCMVTARQLYRAEALEPHRQAIRARTIEYERHVRDAKDGKFADEQKAPATAPAPTTPTPTAPTAPTPAPVAAAPLPGEALFKRTCAACHNLDKRLVGPPLREIATIYAGNPAGIVEWSKKPGKKRADYMQMPPQPYPDADLDAIAHYILAAAAAPAATHNPTTTPVAPPPTAPAAAPVVPAPAPVAPNAQQADTAMAGEKVFKRTCVACHALDKRLVGPPLREIAAIYAGNPAGIVEWSKKPGKKRADYMQMPPQPYPDADLDAVAHYILSIAAPPAAK